MKYFCFLFFLFIYNTSFSQVVTYEKSKIIDRVPVRGTDGETFQMYLPESYNPDALSAIVLIFDPSGNGTKGIKPFITSAEKFNYVLVCSNNTKNGPYKENFNYINNLFAHLFYNFKIDQKQMYTAGFSGGSRLACAVAVLTDAIQGVIACGAGFPNEMDKNPSSESKFSYVGLVGDEDMNYQEMLRVKDWLIKFNVDNESFVYEDGHSWPPKEQIERAFMWLEMQAYKRELRKPSFVRIQEFYNQDLKIADSLSKNHIYKAVVEYERLMRNHASSQNIEIVSEKLRILKKSEKYKDEIKTRERIALEEQKISSKFLTHFHQEMSYGASRDNFAWWRKELKEFEEKYLKSNDYFEKKMGKRIQFRIKAAAFEGSSMHRNTRRLDKAIYCDKLLTQISPDESWTYYRLAETYAMNNDSKKTRVSLQMALDKGYKEYKRILRNPLFVKFKGDKKFDLLINSLND